MIDAIMGKDLITDEELKAIDSAYSGVSSLPVIGDFISWESWIMNILNKLFKIWVNEILYLLTHKWTRTKLEVNYPILFSLSLY